MRLFLGNFIIKHLVTLVVSLAYQKGKIWRQFVFKISKPFTRLRMEEERLPNISHAI